jgi:hypothetical protein
MFDFLSAATWSSRARLNKRGVALLRRFLVEEEVRELRSLVADLYTEIGTCVTFPHPEMERQFKKLDAIWLGPLEEFLPNKSAALSDRYTNLLARIQKKVQRIFGRKWQLYSQRSFVRRIGDGQGKLHVWHIDADAANILRDRCFNVWLPLDRVGTELPSLEIVPGSHAKMRNMPISIEHVPERDEAFVSAMGSPSIPQLDPGDALIFDQFVLHRTQTINGNVAVRTSCELRFTMPESG